MKDSKVGRISRIVKAGFWVYLVSIVNNLSGFIYWLIITRVGGSEILGLTSATVGLAIIVASFVDFGVTIGVQRFLGREWSRNKEWFSDYFWSTFYLRLLFGLLAGVFFLIVGFMRVSYSNYTPEMFVWTGILVLATSLQLFYSYFMSILRTDIYLVSSVVGNILKIVVGVGLVLLGFGFVGAVIGYLILYVMIGVFGFYHIIRNFPVRLRIDFSRVLEVVKAGLASWIPNLITMLGMWVGVLAVFGASGAISTGHYYIAFALFSVVSMIGGSVAQLLLPYLSGVEDNRGGITSRVVFLSLVVVAPIVFLGMVYGWVPLRLLGAEYVSAESILVILLISAIPVIVVLSVTNLVYAVGDYRSVLSIGLFQNVPRLVLYFLVVPFYHGVGAAISFTVGSLISLPYALRVGFRYGFRIEYKKLLLLLLIPGGLSLLSFALDLHWVIGGLIILSSYLIYFRLGLVSRSDLKMIVLAFVSERKLYAYYNKFRWLIDLVLAS